MNAVQLRASGGESWNHCVGNVVFGSEPDDISLRRCTFIARPLIAPCGACDHVGADQPLAFVGQPSDQAELAHCEPTRPKPTNAIGADRTAWVIIAARLFAGTIGSDLVRWRTAFRSDRGA